MYKVIGEVEEVIYTGSSPLEAYYQAVEYVKWYADSDSVIRTRDDRGGVVVSGSDTMVEALIINL
jgi:hypothetical protein